LLVSTTYSALIATACGDLTGDTDAIRLGPEVMIERLCETYGELVTLTAGMHVPRPAVVGL
jgi:hypothetical protein